MIVLASQSPRRKEICASLGFSFEIVPAKNEAEIDMSLSPEKAVEKVALSKAEEVFLVRPDDTVIGSDTAVYLEGAFLGKPQNTQEAYNMLKSLSGKSHKVYTGVAIISKEKRVSFCESADVYFASMTDKEIYDYISTGEPMDKAGAYGIQGYGGRFVKRLEGDFYTVMGLPYHRLYEELKKFGV